MFRAALLSLALAWAMPVVPVCATEPSAAQEPDPDEALLEFLGGLDADFDADGDDDWVEFLASTDVKRAAAKAPPPPPPAPKPAAPPSGGDDE